MNENSFDGLHKYIQLKAFTILSGSAGFPGGYNTSPVFFARTEKGWVGMSYPRNYPHRVIP
jgi:hypothetical protein